MQQIFLQQEHLVFVKVLKKCFKVLELYFILYYLNKLLFQVPVILSSQKFFIDRKVNAQTCKLKFDQRSFCRAMMGLEVSAHFANKEITNMLRTFYAFKPKMLRTQIGFIESRCSYKKTCSLSFFSKISRRGRFLLIFIF